MATQGDLKSSTNSKKSLCLLAGVTAANGQPSLVTDGVPVYPTQVTDGVCYFGTPTDEAAIKLKVVASGGTVAATFRLWGYSSALGEWLPIGTGGDTTKGTLNGGASIGATKTNKVLHVEAFNYVGVFDRLYLEVVSISGTSATAEAWVTVMRLED